LQIEIREKAAKVLKLYKYGMRNIIFPYINNILKKLTNIDNDKDATEKEYIGGYEVLGSVKINSLEIETKILNPEVDGIDCIEDALKYGSILYYGDGLNELGNTTIIAHNDSSNFINLKNIEVDDEIVIVDDKGLETKYTVIEKKDVEPDDFTALLPMEENSTELTLITCNSEGTTRLAVKAISK